MALNLPRLSLQSTLLLGHLSASMPVAVIAAIDGIDQGLLATGLAVILSIMMARLLSQPILEPIRSMSAALRHDWPPGGTASTASSHPLAPAELCEVLSAFDQGRRPRTPHRRRARDQRVATQPGCLPVTDAGRTPVRLLEPALIDPVTRLANRRGVAEHLANVDGESPLDGTTAVHCIAITNLARVRETLGLESGDEILREVARRITDNVRVSDLVARIGPAELAIVQHDVRMRENALSLAQRVKSLIDEPIKIHDHGISTAISIGIALAPAGSEIYTARLIDAEAALQHAKALGPGAICEFNEELRPAFDTSATRKHITPD